MDVVWSWSSARLLIQQLVLSYFHEAFIDQTLSLRPFTWIALLGELAILLFFLLQLWIRFHRRCRFRIRSSSFPEFMGWKVEMIEDFLTCKLTRESADTSSGWLSFLTSTMSFDSREFKDIELWLMLFKYRFEVDFSRIGFLSNIDDKAPSDCDLMRLKKKPELGLSFCCRCFLNCCKLF